MKNRLCVTKFKWLQSGKKAHPYTKWPRVPRVANVWGTDQAIDSLCINKLLVHHPNDGQYGTRGFEGRYTVKKEKALAALYAKDRQILKRSDELATGQKKQYKYRYDCPKCGFKGHSDRVRPRCNSCTKQCVGVVVTS